ncbi:MAG: prepilin-type N-terminal cleavage/methylation domain-containing protein [Candidatus Cloacimonetes bacterium]|nr:prepilin-type N-terminal cleavage/methylation domain-containing protein [Candidatus Cloacimonadota bacterium]MDD4155230.1 prepilin-type N-terminal cleavage/methylation domain-containing protein [Candidatus Cloacimonadota bacterium]
MVLKNENGFTLVEVISSVVLVTVLALGFFIALTHFVTSYQETKDFLTLQEELLKVVNQIRHGYIDSRVANIDRPLIGLMTAQSVKLGRIGEYIEIIPVDGDYGARSWAKYHVDRDGRLLLTARYGYEGGHTNHVIFPSSTEKIGRYYKYRITDIKFQDLTKDIAPTTFLVKMYIQGMVRFREKAKGQSDEEDRVLNTKYVEYETIIYLGNADKNI